MTKIDQVTEERRMIWRALSEFYLDTEIRRDHWEDVEKKLIQNR